MFSGNSESEESLENMKLDLIKAKYAYQKLKNTNSASQKKSKNEYLIHRQHDNITSDFKKQMKSPKISHSPKMSSRKHEVKQNQSKEFEVENSYRKSEDDTDNEDPDLLKMNSYVDYLLNRKRVSTNSCTDKSEILNPIIPIEDLSALNINNYDTSEAYQRNSSDYNQLNIPQSTDILVQWRLRRKMNEAQNSVKLEHQKHNMHIHSLNSQIANNFQGSSFSYLEDKQYVHDFEQVDKAKYSFENECDQVPVRDKISFPTQVPVSVRLPEIVHIKPKHDASSQCCLDKDNQIHKNDSRKLMKIKSCKNSKTFKNAAVMTRNRDRSKKFDGCTQTEPDYSGTNKLDKSNTSLDWDQNIQSPDYIDMAIEKSIQAQLFERNYSSAMSIVTSINDSNHLDVVVHNPNTENNDKDFINIDTNSDEIPWNEHFQITSDDEFQQDDVLIDLRRRRNLNLQKLKNLSVQIQNYQNCNLTPIKS